MGRCQHDGHMCPEWLPVLTAAAAAAFASDAVAPVDLPPCAFTFSFRHIAFSAATLNRPSRSETFCRDPAYRTRLSHRVI